MKRKQRFFKISALVGCILLGVGILLSGAGFVAMGCDLDAFIYPRMEMSAQAEEGQVSTETPGPGDDWAQAEFAPQENISAIEVQASLGRVTVCGDPDLAAPTVRYSPKGYQLEIQENTLVISSLDQSGNGWKWYQLLHLHEPSKEYDLTVSVPEKLLDSVYVESGMGAVHVSDLEAANVTVQGDMGDVTLDNVAASESLTVTQSMGRVTVENCQGGDLTLENDMGDTELSSGSFTEGEITASAGSVGVAGSTFTTLTVENDMGDVNLSATQVSEAVSCAVNMGSIGLDQLASPAITLDADSGNVTGTIAGRQEDYQITVETDLGDSNLQNQLGEGSHLLQVTTNMGNISLDFAE